MTEGDNRSWADKYRHAGEEWADLESAAQLLEDCKSAVMAQKQSVLGDIPVNRAEQTVKASPDWMKYIEECVKARHQANLAKIKLEALKMEFSEWNNSQANERAEFKMTMGGG
jgi:hypothetical protein